MIVRISGEGQYDVDEATVGELNELDSDAVNAVESGDGEGLQRALEAMAGRVRERARRLDDADLQPSGVIVPPPDLTLEEAQKVFQGEGLIPDLPG